jgi:hypothetical protein
VDDLLAHLTNALPAVLNDAGVTLIISKWNEPALQKYPNSEKVDVTLKLIDAFEPNARQRKSAIEIQKHQPIPLEQAETLQD